jgi:hypothetical protein
MNFVKEYQVAPIVLGQKGEKPCLLEITTKRIAL